MDKTVLTVVIPWMFRFIPYEAIIFENKSRLLVREEWAENLKNLRLDLVVSYAETLKLTNSLLKQIALRLQKLRMTKLKRP